MKKYILILLFSILCYLDVIAQREFSDDQLKTRFFTKNKGKKKYKFNREKYKLQTIKNFDKSGIDTNAVYISTFLDEETNIRKYIYTRYFSTGECFRSYIYLSMPTNKEFNDLSNGVWSMFTIDINGVIFGEYYNKYLIHFTYTVSKKQEDKIITYKLKNSNIPFFGTEKVNWIETEYKVKLLPVLNRNW